MMHAATFFGLSVCPTMNPHSPRRHARCRAAAGDQTFIGPMAASPHAPLQVLDPSTIGSAVAIDCVMGTGGQSNLLPLIEDRIDVATIVEHAHHIGPVVIASREQSPVAR
jgi:hypothetical protein